MITLRIGNIFTNIIGDLSSEQYRGLEKVLSFHPEGYQFSPAFNKLLRNKDGKVIGRAWDGWKHQCWRNKTQTYFPTGLISLAIQYFNKQNIAFDYVDYRIKHEPNIAFSEHNKAYTFREYQQEIIDIACNRTRGIIRLPTGGGKTIIGAGIIQQLSVAPFIFFVTSIDLLTQTKESFEDVLRQNEKPIKVGQIGGGVVDIADINVMTVQTAVRALGKSWKQYKYDTDDTDDETNIESRREEIRELISTAKGSICDEIQHWRADTCQLVAREMKDAYFTYGMSATPFRDSGDDMLIQACFGKIIFDTTASELIGKGYLIKPSIKMVHIAQPKSHFRQWQSIYKDQVVENKPYNTMIANIANKFAKAGRLVLCLVQQIQHGKELSSMIDGSIFLSGNSPKGKRTECIKKLRRREISCIVSTSLPYKELLLVRHNGFIKQMEIGDLCHNYADAVSNSELEACCSFDGKKADWSPITNVHIHRRQNKVVRVETNRGEDVFVTENHSLIRPDLTQVLPVLGEDACVPCGIPRQKEPIIEINVAELLGKICDPTVEIEILGLTQPRARQIKSEYRYVYENPQSLSRSTRIKVRKRLSDKNQQYLIAIRQIVQNFKYSKYRYRAKLSSVWWCEELFKEFNCRIFVRRCRKPFSLPVKLPVREELAIISGLMCGDGHIKHHVETETCKSNYAFDFAGLADMSKSCEGKNDNDKLRVRDIFRDSFIKTFGDIELWENWQHIRFRSKLMYYLFEQLGHIDSRGQKRVPDYIYNSTKEIQEAFLWGLYLSDGSKEIAKCKFSAINIRNTSRPLVSGVISLLSILNKKFSVHSYATQTKRIYDIRCRSKIHTLEPSVVRDGIDYSSSKRTQRTVSEVECEDELVYDITVSGTHNFIAGNGVLCHNTIFDEGIDVKPLDTLILAGQGKSRVRAMQRVGRIMRPWTDENGKKKDHATVIDFFLDQKYLKDHAKARLKMYKSEPMFEVEEIEVTL